MEHTMAPSISSTTTSKMIVVAVLLLLFLVALALSQLPQAILATCKTVGGVSTYVGIEFCEDAISSVTGTRVDLDYQLFGSIAVGLLADNATSTKTRIDSLLKAEDKAVVSPCLLSCQSLYGSILDGEPACTAAVKAKKFGDATAILEKAAAAAKECEDGFKSNVTSPLTAEDGNAFELAKLGVELLRFA